MLSNQWQSFLATQSLQFNVDNTTDFTALVNRDALTPISVGGILKVGGDDALRFLQGQCTCDVHAVNTITSKLGAFCTPKGRMYANFRMIFNDHAFLLLMNSALIEPTQLTLDKYIRFFKASMQDVSTQWIRLGISGQNSTSLLRKISPSLPTHMGDVTPMTDGFIVQLSHTPFRYEIWINALETAKTIWSSLAAADCNIAPPTFWEWLDIEAGLAWITRETAEAFTPHMINYQAVDGISFTKGCYTGQEIVARTHYLGKLKKHLYRLSVRTHALPSPGCPVMQHNEHVGEVVNAVAINSTHIELLAVLQAQSVTEGGLSINANPAQLITLPYALGSD